MIDHDLERFLLSEGYTNLRDIEGMVCGCYRFIFTSGVCYGIDFGGLAGRFCFDTKANARLFLKEWDGIEKPIVGLDGCTAIK